MRISDLSSDVCSSDLGRRDRTFELVTEVTRSTYDAFNAITGRVAARVSYDSTPIWQKKFTYSYGVELIATREDDYDFATGDRSYDFYTILGLTGQVGLDRTDSLLDPTKRSEERRVGHACVSTCRYRGSPSPYKTTHK